MFGTVEGGFFREPGTQQVWQPILLALEVQFLREAVRRVEHLFTDTFLGSKLFYFLHQCCFLIQRVICAPASQMNEEKPVIAEGPSSTFGVLLFFQVIFLFQNS